MSEQAGLRPPPRNDGGACSLADKVAWLSSQLGPGDEAIETHFAWVFLVGERAWKLRKPVRRDTMDFSTVEARRVDSESDVRLNRRLAPAICLRTRPLTLDRQGGLAIGGSGEVVDWLVEMRRIDRGRMLDAMLARDAVRDADLVRVAALLAGFYAAEPLALDRGDALLARLRAQVHANHGVVGALEAAVADPLRDAQLAFLDAHHDWLQLRASHGCVIEGHGDLRPEHVSLEEPPAVIDCLEFDRNLRVMDRAEELAFLELECGRLGHATAGRRIASECLARLDDRIPEALMWFYRSHRAATRAKLYVWRANEPDGGSPQHWLTTARDYLGMARAAILPRAVR
jgi:aminoglycoside phosphotransferase family enzyme